MISQFPCFQIAAVVLEEIPHTLCHRTEIPMSVMHDCCELHHRNSVLAKIPGFQGDVFVGFNRLPVLQFYANNRLSMEINLNGWHVVECGIEIQCIVIWTAIGFAFFGETNGVIVCSNRKKIGSFDVSSF